MHEDLDEVGKCFLWKRYLRPTGAGNPRVTAGPGREPSVPRP